MLGQDMKRLTEDIIALYDTRASFVNELIRETAGKLETFRSDRSEMSHDLREALQSGLRARRNTVHQFLAESRDHMKELAKAHKIMSKELSEFLNSSEATRKDQFAGMMTAIRSQLLVIRSVTQEILDSSRELLESFGKEHQEMAGAWRDMSESLEARRTARVRKARNVEKSKEKEREIEALKQGLLNTISESGEGGIKLAEMGAELERSWQSLIPLVTELVDQGQVVKDNMGYYRKS